MSVHGAAYDSAATAVITAKKTARINALRNVVMSGLYEKCLEELVNIREMANCCQKNNRFQRANAVKGSLASWCA
jgi:hypothetical protein